MRDFKFRAWHNDSMCMLHEYKPGDCLVWFSQGQPVEVMQCTGLKDCKGREIFEGDILRAGNEDVCLVDYSKEFASFVLNKKGWMHSHYLGDNVYPEDCEVLGNRFENPELLEVM